MFTEDSRLDVISIDAVAPIPTGLNDVSFDMIVLSPTFLAARYSQDLLNLIKSKFSFIESSTALKVAMPQDDYDCSSILDDWVTEWNVDLTYSICPHNWELLYPRFHQTGRLRLGFTGYILKSQLKDLSKTKRWEERSIDVSYRTSRLPPNFGALGHLKSDIINLFKQKLPTNHELVLSLSTRAEDRIGGHAWHSFLEDSRFVLVSPSGSSLIDPFGDLRQTAKNCLMSNLGPDDFLDAVSGLRYAECANTMISPRNIEACLLGTVQVAITAEYSGILKANDHYIPFDSSPNLKSRLGDKSEWEKLRHCAFDAILSVPQLRAANFVNELIQEAASRSRTFNSVQKTFEPSRKPRLYILRKRVAYQTLKYWLLRRAQGLLEAGFGFFRAAARQLISRGVSRSSY